MKHGIVGLTGGIGSGKTTVASFFAKHGIAVVDTDIIAREMTQKDGIAIPVLKNTFSQESFLDDGSLNRPYMRQLIYSDATAKKNLERILHPLILEKSQQLLVHIDSLMPYHLLVVPLLFENYQDYRSLIHRTLLVDCDESLQMARILQRDQYPEAIIRTIIASQYTRQQKLSFADDFIINQGDQKALALQVAKIHHFYRRYFAN
jgi:dephospho-CoA kinase